MSSSQQVQDSVALIYRLYTLQCRLMPLRIPDAPRIFDGWIANNTDSTEYCTGRPYRVQYSIPMERQGYSYSKHSTETPLPLLNKVDGREIPHTPHTRTEYAPCREIWLLYKMETSLLVLRIATPLGSFATEATMPFHFRLLGSYYPGSHKWYGCRVQCTSHWPVG